VLGYPAHFARTAATIWLAAALVFSAINVTAGVAVAASIAVTVLLGGLSAVSLEYLLVERVMRPLTALALAGEAPSRPTGPGVSARLLTAWTLATGVPLLGIVAIAI